MIPTNGNDFIRGTLGADLIDALAGNDTVNGDNGDDTLIGGNGDDTLTGGDGNDIINGGVGNDDIRGNTGADILDGGDGSDLLEYGNSDAAILVNLETNTASGGHAEGDVLSNFERINGSNFDDNLTGDAENNILRGRHGNDSLQGNGGDDKLLGENGDDFLNGYGYTEEYDILTGGEGADTFVLGDDTFLNDGTAYYGEAAGLGFARITDFDRTQGDKFQVFGDIADYSLTYGDRYGSSAQDTFIEYQDDLIAIVQDTTDINLNLDFDLV